MKAILKFNLDDFEDNQAHLRCTKASDMAGVLWELKHNFMRKYEEMECIDYTQISEDLYDLMEDINVDELTG